MDFVMKQALGGKYPADVVNLRWSTKGLGAQRLSVS